MLPEYALRAIRQRRGLEEDDTTQDSEINALPLKDALDEYLSWEGIHGYTSYIMGIIKAKTPPKGT